MAQPLYLSPDALLQSFFQLQVKPLIQDAGTHEKPYMQDLKLSTELARKSGMGDARTTIMSTSMVLRDEEEQSMTHSRLARLTS